MFRFGAQMTPSPASSPPTLAPAPSSSTTPSRTSNPSTPPSPPTQPQPHHLFPSVRQGVAHLAQLRRRRRATCGRARPPRVPSRHRTTISSEIHSISNLYLSQHNIDEVSIYRLPVNASAATTTADPKRPHWVHLDPVWVDGPRFRPPPHHWPSALRLCHSGALR
jgi:hypothetical protein